MNQKSFMTIIMMMISVLFAVTGFANPGKPSFEPELYAGGKVQGTKGTTNLPAPSAHNLQSFDKLFVITNSNNPQGQMPVGEAAPGNPDYKGGRWFTHTVEWTEAGFMAHGIVPVLTSYDEIMDHEDLEQLVITPGSFPQGPPV